MDNSLTIPSIVEPMAIRFRPERLGGHIHVAVFINGTLSGTLVMLDVEYFALVQLMADALERKQLRGFQEHEPHA